MHEKGRERATARADIKTSNPAAAKSPATVLRSLLHSGQTEFLLEAHNGISSRIVEEAGFRGIWASGLAIAAQYGVRDSNEASWTQVLDTIEFMVDATSIPILVDGDTGFGNFNNVRRLVRKLGQRGAAGVCIEDKVFPKTNSFLGGDDHPLANIDEFCGRIRAAKDAQLDDHFCVVARVEALIAGRPMAEALERGEAYADAGADAIFIHSKHSDFKQIESFTAEWGDRTPIVIAPTTYWQTPTDSFRSAGVSLVLWANHMIRASVTAMQAVARDIAVSHSQVDVHNNIAPVDEIFRLQNVDELRRAEDIYTKCRGKSSRDVADIDQHSAVADADPLLESRSFP